MNKTDAKYSPAFEVFQYIMLILIGVPVLAVLISGGIIYVAVHGLVSVLLCKVGLHSLVRFSTTPELSRCKTCAGHFWHDDGWRKRYDNDDRNRCELMDEYQLCRFDIFPRSS